jgi:hypothetical protein
MTYTRTQPVWVDDVTPADALDLENWEKGLLATNNDTLALQWNGSTYLPKNGDATAKADTGKKKNFGGSADPTTVTGVVVAEGDTWDQYA